MEKSGRDDWEDFNESKVRSKKKELREKNMEIERHDEFIYLFSGRNYLYYYVHVCLSLLSFLSLLFSI